MGYIFTGLKVKPLKHQCSIYFLNTAKTSPMINSIYGFPSNIWTGALNYVFTAAGLGLHSIFILLDLRASCGTINHIQLHLKSHRFSGSLAPKWSYVSHLCRELYVNVGGLRKTIGFLEISNLCKSKFPLTTAQKHRLCKIKTDQRIFILYLQDISFNDWNVSLKPELFIAD